MDQDLADRVGEIDMAVNLFGNIDGISYQPQNYDLFEKVKSQNTEPDTINTRISGFDGQNVKVNISDEGLKALHGSKLTGSFNPDDVINQKKFMTEHQPIECFERRFSNMMPSNYKLADNGEYGFVHHSFQDKADALLSGLEKIQDEISKGYASGTRVRYIEDTSSADGYRKLTKDEELSILSKEFDDFVDKRFGIEHQKQSEKVIAALNDFQKIKQSMGKTDIRNYEPELIPDGFSDQLKAAAKKIIYGKSDT